MTPILPDPHHPTSEELFAYRDGELTADRRMLIEAHVLACGVCRDRIDEMSAAEAELKRRADGVGEEYFERMTESVLGRIGAAGREAREAGRSSANTRTDEGVVPSGPAPVSGARGGYVEVPRVDRRRPDSTVEDFGPRRRLHLPWIGITGGAAAAVAVVVVAVVLFHRQNEWVRAPRPGVVGEPRADATADSMLARTGEASSGVAGSAPPAQRQAKASARNKADVGKRAGGAAKSEMKAAAGVTAPEEVLAKDQAARLRENAARSVPSVGGRIEAQEDRKLMAVQSAPSAAAPAPSNEYANVLRAYRLPPLWNSGVSTDAVERAESDLRYLYQTGRAGADSARIRLYLAEAERARLTDPSNTAAVESISHHYRRAISLADGDGALAATARRRLSEFEQEMTRARGSQP